MSNSGLENRLNSIIQMLKNEARQSSYKRTHGSPVSRKKAIDDLAEAVHSAEIAACKILQVLKGRGGDVPAYTRDRDCVKDIEYTFNSTYKNTASLYVLLEHMDDIVKKLD